MRDARELAALMGRFGRSYCRWARSQSEQAGGGDLTQAGLLFVLHGEGPLKMTHLGRHLGVTPRSVTKLVDALEAGGLVRRKPAPGDRRATLVELTPCGRGQVEGQFCQGMEAVASLFEELSTADREHMTRVLERLLEALERRGC